MRARDAARRRACARPPALTPARPDTRAAARANRAASGSDGACAATSVESARARILTHNSLLQAAFEEVGGKRLRYS